MIGSRFALVFASVMLLSIVVGARAEAAYTSERLAESAALRSVLCDDVASGSALGVMKTALNCGGAPQSCVAKVAGLDCGSHLTSASVRPAGCLTKTVSGKTVTLRLKGCKGSYSQGLIGQVILTKSVTGTVIAVFSKDATGIHIHATGNGIAIGVAALDVDDTTTYKEAKGVETVSVSHSSSGLGLHGHTVSNTSSLTSVTDTSAGCVTRNGNWKVTNNGVTSLAASVNFKRCSKPDGTFGCPSGTVTSTISNRTTTLSYNGSSMATAGMPNGTSQNIPLTCIP
jgi:hypothetical protein